MPMSLQIGKYISKPEEDLMVKNERIRRRNARLKQVRQLAKENAVKIFKAVSSEKQTNINKLKTDLRNEWTKEKEEKIATVGREYERCLENIGEGHKDVVFEEARIEILKSDAMQNKFTSATRGISAMKQLTHCQSRELSVKNRKKELRKKMFEYGKRVSRTNIVATEGVNCLLNEMPKLIVNEETEIDARLAAEKENEKYMQLEQLYEQHKNVQGEKVQQRFLLAKEALDREKNMNAFVNKLEDFNDLSNCSVNDVKKMNLNENCEKAIEELFNNRDLPMKFSFLDTSSERATTELSKLSSETSSSMNRTVATHVVISKHRVRAPTPTITSSSSNIISSCSISSVSITSVTHLDSTSSVELSDYLKTDDSKKSLIDTHLTENETILAGNLDSVVKTISFTDSSGTKDCLSGSGTSDLSTLKSTLDSGNETDLEKNTEVEDNPLDQAILENSNNAASENLNSENVKSSPGDVIATPYAFQNVVISTKPSSTSFETVSTTEASQQRSQQLKTLISLALQSKKDIVLRKEDDKQLLLEPTNKEFDKNNGEQFALWKVPPHIPPKKKHQNKDLSTIIELDTPQSSILQQSCLSSCLKYGSTGDSNSLFELISENENGILEEPDLTLVSSITASGDFQEDSIKSEKRDDIPFIVTNVTSKTIQDRLSKNLTNVDNDLLKKKLTAPELSAESSDSSLSFLNRSSILSVDTPTIDSTWEMCFTNEKFSSYLAMKSGAKSDSSHSSSKLQSSNSGSEKRNSLEEASITTELLSNSLISFLAHEMSANNDGEMKQSNFEFSSINSPQ